MWVASLGPSIIRLALLSFAVVLDRKFGEVPERVARLFGGPIERRSLWLRSQRIYTREQGRRGRGSKGSLAFYHRHR